MTTLGSCLAWPARRMRSSQILYLKKWLQQEWSDLEDWHEKNWLVEAGDELNRRDKRRPNPAKLEAENAETHWVGADNGECVLFIYLFIPLVSHLFIKRCFMQLTVINTKWTQIKSMMMRWDEERGRGRWIRHWASAKPKFGNRFREVQLLCKFKIASSQRTLKTIWNLIIL